MLLFVNIRIAFRALMANKMRSFLTILGIVIGVSAVVALLSIGKGATASVTSQVEGIGSNLLTVMPGQLTQGLSQGQQARLYYDDFEVLADNLKGISAIAPSFQSSLEVKYEEESSQVQVVGTTPEYFQIRSSELDLGRPLTAADVASENRVAVIGPETASDFFGNVNPLGQKINIGGVSFSIVGVLEAKGGMGFANQDNIILIPLQTGYTKLFGANASDNGRRTLTDISVSAVNSDEIDRLSKQIEFIMRRQHRLSPGEESDFSAFSQTQILDTLNTITNTLTIFLGAIAAISLLVGGIGIMNISLVSVTERTREIGLRKAVGAKRSAILMQFLVETVTLSLLGGIVGIILGVGIAQIFTLTGAITADVTANTIMLAFFFSAAVGLFFGIYPANRASKLRPMDALRYE